ncbi:glycosyltransferase family 4 protein [Candidatus Kuenenbacteria bacterium]|nr:glycosyltransferase family 4 protein [Candidatus Kuenenbacteria bacterium]
MKVLMISTDLALLGENTSTGDAVTRHRAYGNFVEKLSILVFTKNKNYQPSALSPNVSAYPTNSYSFLFFIKNAVALAKELFSLDKYDLIVCQDPFLTGLTGYLLKKKYNARLLVDFHGDFWKNHYWLWEKIWRLPLLALSKIVVKKADALRTVSGGIKKKIIQSGFKKIPIKVLPTPVNLEHFKTPDLQTASSIRQVYPDKKIILWTGRMTPEKNLPFLVSCFKKIINNYPNVVLLLIGDGPEKNKITQQIKSMALDPSVKLLGQINYTQLLNYFHAADIFVLPSRHESFGKVLLEAGASGKPSVASATTGTKEIIIEGETGFLFPVNKTKKFVEKTLVLLNDENLAHRIGANAYQHIWTKYNYETSVKNITAYWQKIANNKN